MTYVIDLDTYFDRIGYGGSAGPDERTLHDIVAAHVRAIPFENFDVALGRGVSVEPSQIVRKLVDDRRGGYCFEQNGLMLLVLGALGYDVQPISARVRLGQARTASPARTHLLLRVELDRDAWLVDVGVGGLTPPAPLRLQLDEPQPTSHETRRIVSDGPWTGLEERGPTGRLFHQVLLGDEWTDLYDFTLEEMFPVDRELANWYTSTHPTSKFRREVIAARVTDSGRVTLLDRELKHRDKQGVAVTRQLKSDEELLAVLDAEFGIRLEAGTRFDCLGDRGSPS
jgi:N-hydroxyarylamine O-acetyltransferase